MGEGPRIQIGSGDQEKGPGALKNYERPGIAERVSSMIGHLLLAAFTVSTHLPSPGPTWIVRGASGQHPLPPRPPSRPHPTSRAAEESNRHTHLTLSLSEPSAAALCPAAWHPGPSGSCASPPARAPCTHPAARAAPPCRCPPHLTLQPQLSQAGAPQPQVHRPVLLHLLGMTCSLLV